MAGIFLGTFISTMTTCFWIEPVVLFHYGFHAPVKRYFQEYAVNTLVTLATGTVVWWLCTLLPGSGMILFCGKAAVCLVAGNLGYLLAYHRREEFRYFLQLASGMVRRFKR